MSAGENLAKVDNYYPLDYNAIHESYESMEPVNGGEAKRFVKYEERERQSVLTSDMFNVFGSGKFSNLFTVRLVRFDFKDRFRHDFVSVAV